MSKIAERKRFLEDQLKEIEAKNSRRRDNSAWLFIICFFTVFVAKLSGYIIAWIIAAVLFFWAVYWFVGLCSLEESHKKYDLMSRLDELQKLELD